MARRRKKLDGVDLLFGIAALGVKAVAVAIDAAAEAEKEKQRQELKKAREEQRKNTFEKRQALKRAKSEKQIIRAKELKERDRARLLLDISKTLSTVAVVEFGLGKIATRKCAVRARSSQIAG